MTRRDVILVCVSVAALGSSAVLFARHWRSGSDGETKAFFYDLSEKKLFSAPARLVSPAKGLDGAEEDAVRAVVISTNGNPKDKSSWKIAYLEKYSSEMKQEFEKAQRSGTAPSVSRAFAQFQRFVKRPEDAQWYPINTAEAGKILNEWLTAGPGGSSAVVCTP
jgi:hypothetical protein